MLCGAVVAASGSAVRLESDVSIVVTVDGAEVRLVASVDEAADAAAKTFCGRHGISGQDCDSVRDALGKKQLEVRRRRGLESGLDDEGRARESARAKAGAPRPRRWRSSAGEAPEELSLIHI